MKAENTSEIGYWVDCNIASNDMPAEAEANIAVGIVPAIQLTALNMPHYQRPARPCVAFFTTTALIILALSFS